MKLAIGTAQFGMNYNLYSSETMSEKEVYSIIEYARRIGIDTIDTAIGYGSAETKLGRAGVSDFKIITKLSKISSKKNIKKFIFEEVNKSLERLNVSSLYGLLLHSPNDILCNHNNEIIETIEQLKKNNIIHNFGYSIYEPGEIDNLENSYNSDILQVPYNLLDKRFKNIINLNLEKTFPKKIYVRSIFLRGILLHQNPSAISKYFSNWDNFFLSWKKWLIENDIDPLSVCVNYIKNNYNIERAIVGIDSLDQLKSIYSAYVSNRNLYPKNFYSNDIYLIDPRKWNL